MTTDEVEKKLKRVKKGNVLIQRLQLKYQSLDNGLLSGSNQFQPRVTMSKTNTAEDKILEILELKDEIVEQMSALIDERMEAMDMINQLEEIEEWLVLMMIYFNGFPIDQVCNQLGFGKAQIYRFRRKAIEHLADMG